MEKELINVKLSRIKPYEKNPRVNESAVPFVKESISQCGYISPIIVDEKMVVLAGHTRLLALKRLGTQEADVIKITGLTEDQKKKFRVLDNHTGSFAEWDLDLLMGELDGLDFDGFDFHFDDLFASDGGGEEPPLMEEMPAGLVDIYTVVVNCANADEAQNAYERINDIGIECRIETKKG